MKPQPVKEESTLHTQGEWKVVEMEKPMDNTYSSFWIQTDEELIAKLDVTDKRLKNIYKANARRIVEAINNFDRLTEENKALICRLDAVDKRNYELLEKNELLEENYLGTQINRDKLKKENKQLIEHLESLVDCFSEKRISTLTKQGQDAVEEIKTYYSWIFIQVEKANNLLEKLNK